ncbi:hypothetical protein M6B38_405995 [Iris pallida]|uniref:Uncharacterized protein n=1 Tax=Iris pallida TaxID=29817 RepID=A0AAX6FQY8_IRIPA|nr:hypothetical protein M6B38_405995 [Iris pallida]
MESLSLSVKKSFLSRVRCSFKKLFPISI